jgi:hypothetical protein
VVRSELLVELWSTATRFGHQTVSARAGMGAVGVLARIGERVAPPRDETGGSSTTSAAGVGQAAQSAQQP